mmetsp:Transcript_4188/g.6385  ORF Transcript_4188/g.6385 Transcript_4188/m.6385 type:complete len:151 (-) Transcript_4188:6-458(-)
MACYLTFDVANLGTLVATWSEEPIEGALAVVRPGKPVPKFKFKQRGGRVEVIRKIREDIKKLYQGWVEFIKLAKQNDGTFELLEPRGVTVTFNKFSELEHVVTGEEYISGDYSGVAVCGKDADPYKSVKTMSNGQFLDVGLQYGHSLSLL